MSIIVAADVVCAIFLMISICSLISTNDKTEASCSLLFCMILDFVWQFVDAMMYLVDGPAYHPAFIYGFYFASFWVAGLEYISFSNYCRVYFFERSSLKRRMYFIPMINMSITMILFTVYLIQGRMMLLIDGHRVVISYFPMIMMVINEIFLCLMIILSILMHRIMGMRTLVVFCLYGLALNLAYLIDVYVGLDFSSVFNGMAIVSIVNFVQNREVRKKQEILYHQLEQSNIKLTELTDEQQKQIADISNLNRQLKENLEKVNVFAALSYGYASIHIADLDNETFTTVQLSSGMERMQIDSQPAPYEETVRNIILAFVMKDEQEAFLQFVELEAMKKRMEEQKVFSYRYAIQEDESGDYIYEMTFVCVNEDPSRHLLIIGTKCIDSILKFEREEGLYNAALLSECDYFYEFDVTHGILDGDFHLRNSYDPLFGKNLQFPVKYDEFNQFRTNTLDIAAYSEEETLFWTCDGLKRAFEDGKKMVTLQYSSEQLERYWDATIILTEDATSHHLHAVYICKDVTERVKADIIKKKKLERAAAAADAANRAKTSFLFNMSHDIRTPMNAILGYTDLLQRNIDDTEKCKDYLDKIKDAGNFLLSLINNVLEMARIESGKLSLHETPSSPIEITREIGSVYSELMRIKEIRFTQTMNVITPYVFADKTKIKQIYLNILSNAYKYTPSGGAISVDVTELPSVREDYIQIRTTICDTGIGMSKEFLPTIFEEFSREQSVTDSRIEGTGLGMPIIKRLIDFMGGSVEVESELGKGSTFVVTLPFRIARELQIPGSKEVDYRQMNFKGKRILLAEDNDLNAEIASALLEEYGFSIERAQDGIICVDTLIEAESRYYDLILMDVQMPNRNGYEATRCIRELKDREKANIPIIAMTANAFEEDKQDAYTAGMNGHVAKPIDINNLMKTITMVFQEKESASPI